MHQEFHDVVDAAKTYVHENGFQAHSRRQEAIGTCGTTMRSIRDHLQNSIPGLKESHPDLSKSVYFRLMDF